MISNKAKYLCQIMLVMFFFSNNVIAMDTEPLLKSTKVSDKNLEYATFNHKENQFKQLPEKVQILIFKFVIKELLKLAQDFEIFFKDKNNFSNLLLVQKEWNKFLENKIFLLKQEIENDASLANIKSLSSLDSFLIDKESGSLPLENRKTDILKFLDDLIPTEMHLKKVTLYTSAAGMLVFGHCLGIFLSLMLDKSLVFGSASNLPVLTSLSALIAIEIYSLIKNKNSLVWIKPKSFYSNPHQTKKFLKQFGFLALCLTYASLRTTLLFTHLENK